MMYGMRMRILRKPDYHHRSVNDAKLAIRGEKIWGLVVKTNYIWNKVQLTDWLWDPLISSK